MRPWYETLVHFLIGMGIWVGLIVGALYLAGDLW